FLQLLIGPRRRTKLTPVAVSVAQDKFVGRLLGRLECLLGVGGRIHGSDFDNHRRPRGLEPRRKPTHDEQSTSSSSSTLLGSALNSCQQCSHKKMSPSRYSRNAVRRALVSVP